MSDGGSTQDPPALDSTGGSSCPAAALPNGPGTTLEQKGKSKQGEGGGEGNFAAGDGEINDDDVFIVKDPSSTVSTSIEARDAQEAEMLLQYYQSRVSQGSDPLRSSDLTAKRDNRGPQSAGSSSSFASLPPLPSPPAPEDHQQQQQQPPPEDVWEFDGPDSNGCCRLL